MSPLLVLPSIAGALLSLSVSVALCLRRPGTAWRDAAIAGVSVAWWCAGQIGWLVTGPSQRLAVAQLQYVGIALTPALWLMTALAFVGRREWLTLARRGSLLLIPGLTILAAFTNEAHGLVWQRFVPGPGPGQADIVYGSWFVVHTIYSYGVAALGTLILAGRFAASPLYRPQLAVVLLGPGIVLIMNLTYLSARSALPIDPTPASFAIMFFGVAWAMLRHRFFELLPLARGVTVESLRDGMIVLDEAGRIVDTNPAARAFMGASGAEPLGANLGVLMPFLRLPPGNDAGPSEVPLPDGRRIEVRVSRVTAGNGAPEGAIILLRDITAERMAQEELLRAQEQLRQANRELEKLALTDSLTGLANRRSLSARLEEEFARARRHDRALSFVMMDIDHFKRINDEHGHPAGDRVLEAMGRALSALVRPGDLAVRLGGEEFGVLLPDTTLTEACEVARRLHLTLRALPLEAPDRSSLNARLSLGVATLGPGDPGPQDFVTRADAALYRTKSTGRDGITREAESGFERLS